MEDKKQTAYPAQHEVPAKVCKVLTTILSWPRPHNTQAETMFREWLTDQIKLADDTAVVTVTSGGNLYVDKRNGKPGTQVLFSCHMDTVDGGIWGNPKTVRGKPTHQVKKLTYDANFGEIALDRAGEVGAVGTCLGADDGVGVWLMLKMLQARVPGGYIFHTGEECGGVGSRAMVDKHRDILAHYGVALAFDRPHNDEVIIHQRGVECASVECGAWLATTLNKAGFNFATSTRGVFTDTANYRKLVPECLNLGVGYDRQHGINETLDYAHAHALMQALITLDWTDMPVKRDHTKPDYVPQQPGLFKGFMPEFKAVPKQSKYDPPKYEEPKSEFDDLMTRPLSDILVDMDYDSDYMEGTVLSLMVEVGRLRAEVAVLRAMGKKAEQ